MFVFPALSAATAGAMLVLQILLAFAVSGARGQANIWIGIGNAPNLERAARRHANLAENAGLFVVGFTLLELSGRWPTLLLILCPGFIVVRLFHAVGLSQENTNNPFRLIGGVGTYLIGLVLGGALLWLSAVDAIARY